MVKPELDPLKVLFDDLNAAELAQARKAIFNESVSFPHPSSLDVYRKAIAATPEIKDLLTRNLFKANRDSIVYRNAFPKFVESDKEHLWAYDNLPEFRAMVDGTVEQLVAILAMKRITE